MTDEVSFQILSAEKGDPRRPEVVGIFQFTSGETLYLPFQDGKQYHRALNTVLEATQSEEKAVSLTTAELWESLIKLEGLQFITPMSIDEYQSAKENGLLP